MCQTVTRRWKSEFPRSIQAYGVEPLALQLDIRPSAIYHWIRAATTPGPAHAVIIQRLARDRGYRLAMDDIYGHSRAVREDEIKPATMAPPAASVIPFRAPLGG